MTTASSRFIERSRGSAILELAIFGAITIGFLGFFLRALAMQSGTVRASQQAFRACLAHAAIDNKNVPYEARAITGYAQVATPQPSLGSWEASATDSRGGCFVEWGRQLTMSLARNYCGSGTGDPYGVVYSGTSGVSTFTHSANCNNAAIDTTTTVGWSEALMNTTIEHDTSNKVTTAKAIISSNVTLSTTGLASASHSVGASNIKVEGSSRVRTD